MSALQARLKVAAHQAEEESEETAENFLEGKTEIDDFLASFMEKRTVLSNNSKLYSTKIYINSSPSLMEFPFIRFVRSSKTAFLDAKTGNMEAETSNWLNT